MNEEKAERLIERFKKARAEAPPRPHDDHTREHYEQCVPCREWERAREASLETIETEEGMIKGGLMAIRFIAMATKVEALMEPRPAGHAHSSREEIKQCPECQKQDKARAAAWERVSKTPPEEMVKEIGVGLEWAANAKAAMLPVIDALKKAAESGDLPDPPEHMRTHKSQKEMLACDICNGWIKRRDAIVKDALPPHNLRST
jgi:hypothetical protein